MADPGAYEELFSEKNSRGKVMVFPCVEYIVRHHFPVSRREMIFPGECASRLFPGEEAEDECQNRSAQQGASALRRE
jgi:hypothetical protein